MSEIDKLNIGRLEIALFDLKKNCDVGDKEVFQKDVYDQFVKQVNAMATTDKSDLIKKLTMAQKFVELKKHY